MKNEEFGEIRMTSQAPDKKRWLVVDLEVIVFVPRIGLFMAWVESKCRNWFEKIICRNPFKHVQKWCVSCVLSGFGT